MRIQLPEMLKLYAEGKAQLSDIRFQKEYTAWRVGLGEHILLDELPDRLDELDANNHRHPVPHYDRAEIARLYLAMKGYQARYLTDGLLGIAKQLRGDIARDYMDSLKP